MRLPYRIRVAPPAPRAVRRRLRRRRAQAAVVAVVLGIGGLTTAGGLALRHTAATRGAVAVVSMPTGAAVSLDGRGAGRTPTVVAAGPGEHRLVIGGGALEAAPVVVRVRTAETSTATATLWRAAPVVRALRAPLPGAQIERAGFLTDGTPWLAVAPSADSVWQLWRLDAHGVPVPFGPAALRGPAAPSPDGRRIAAPATPSAAASRAALEIRAVDGGAPPRRSPLPTNAGGVADLAWAPDGRRVLVVTTEDAGGEAQSAFSLIDAASGTVRRLAALPSTVVAGSVVWRPDGGALAFVAAAPDGPVLCLLDIGSGAVRSLADLPGATPPAVAPLAWAPDGRRAIYTGAVPVAHPGLAGLLAPGAATQPALFLLPGPDALGRPLNLGGGAPVWRADGLVLAVVADKQGPALQLLDPADGTSWPAGALAVPGSGALALRWDAAHAQALAVRGGDLGGPSHALLSFAPEVQP